MRSMLGVSVGATVIQLARPRRDADLIEVQSITARGEEVASLAAETVAAALDSRAEPTAVAITYGQPEQADQLQAALDQLQVSQYELVSEVSAALEYFDAQGAEPELGAVAVCDLGASGFTVTIVDWETGDVHLSQRTTDISGDVVDGLIRDHQLSLGTVEPPERATELLLLDAQCRSAKEQLSQSNAAAITGELGVVLLAQHDFHNLITAPIQWAARYAQDVIWRSGVGVGSVIAIGGGARIQLFCETLAQVTGLPVITDPEPDTVAARGAALIATEFADHLEDEQVNEPEAPVNAAEQSVTAAPASGTRRGALALAGIVATALIVVAGIGLMLGYGGEKSAPANTGVSALPSTSAPATSSVAADGQPGPQTENTPPAAAETAAVPEQAPRRPPVIRRTQPPPPPPAVNIPGLPPIFLPPPLQPAPPPPSGQRPPPIFPGLAPR